MTVEIARNQASEAAGATMPALLAGAVSAGLLLSAFAFQYLGGLAPCEMCIWQRWPHGASIVFGLIGGGLVAGKVIPQSSARTLALLAIAALVITGAIGIFHAGVEWKWWPGPPACTGVGYVPGQNEDRAFQIVRCDEAQWRLLGISLAGYNAVVSLAVAGLAFSLLKRVKNEQDRG